MNEEKKPQWHPAFYAAMKLQLSDFNNYLEYHAEHILNTMPIKLDLLVIKKVSDIAIKNEIGEIFRGHNIIEYKSPEDELGIDEYYKVLSYACLYKAGGDEEDAIKDYDVTLTLVREAEPRKLLNWYKNNGCEIEEKYPGIFYITGNRIIFPTQVVVSSLFNKGKNIWIKSLTRRLNEEDGRQLIVSADSLSSEGDKRNVDSVMQVVINENGAIFNKLKEDTAMCEALNRLMQPELNEAKAQTKAESLVMYVEKVSKAFGITIEEACNKLDVTFDEYESAKKQVEKIVAA